MNIHALWGRANTAIPCGARSLLVSYNGLQGGTPLGAECPQRCSYPDTTESSRDRTGASARSDSWTAYTGGLVSPGAFKYRNAPDPKKEQSVEDNSGPKTNLAVSSTEFCQGKFDEDDISITILVVGYLFDLLFVKLIDRQITPNQLKS
jgi:hypothetical protein